MWTTNYGLWEIMMCQRGFAKLIIQPLWWRMLMEESRQRLGREYKYSLCFSEAHFMPLGFYERSTLVLVFINWKKLKRGFCLTKSRKASKISTQPLYYSKMLQRQLVNLSNRSDTSKLLPGNYVIFQHQAITALNDVCEHLHFILIYFVHPSGTYVLR